MVRRYSAELPVVVIPNGVFPDEFAELPTSHRAAELFPELAGRRYILFLGRLHPKKGIGLLVNAFSEISRRAPDVDLVIAGPDYGAEQAIRTAASEQGVMDRVHLVGTVVGLRKFALLTGAAVFCLPSEHETFSMAIVEAMACALPVVISEQCSFPEAEAFGGGIVCPLDEARVREALLALLEDPEALLATGQRARSTVMKHFTWPAIAGRLIESYQ